GAVELRAVHRRELDTADREERESLETAITAHELGNEVVGGMCEELRRRRVLHEMAQAHHRDAVAELDRLIDVVRHEDDRYALGALQPEELVLETLAHDRVDRREGLVHEHQRRLRRHRARDADTLALAARELRRIAAAHALGIEP